MHLSHFGWRVRSQLGGENVDSKWCVFYLDTDATHVICVLPKGLSQVLQWLTGSKTQMYLWLQAVSGLFAHEILLPSSGNS